MVACETDGRSAPTVCIHREPSNLVASIFYLRSGRLKVTFNLTGLESLSMPHTRVRQMQGTFGEVLTCSHLIGMHLIGPVLSEHPPPQCAAKQTMPKTDIFFPSPQ